MLPLTLDQLGKDFKGTQARIAVRKNLLLSELGPHAWEGGRWDNQMGQIGLHVTAAGLSVLQRSANAVSFRSDRPWTSYTKLSGLDGSHAEIDRLLDSQGFIDAAITLNVQGLAFDTLKDGSVRLQSNTQTIEEGRSLARTLLSGMTERQLPARTAALAGVSSMTEPTMALRLSREGVLKLAESDLVRDINPVGFKDARPLKIDTDALQAAQLTGMAEVIITIRTPLFGGNQSKASFAAQTQAYKRALTELAADAGIRSQLDFLPRVGVMTGRLGLDELKALQNQKDARLLAISLNKPVAVASLTASTALMNMPTAWAANQRGAGQNIIVLDTGVQRNHVFFRDAAGNSRVFFEGCYGTNGVSNGVQYESVCPQQGTGGARFGDSPGGLAGSAAPVLNCAADNRLCSHGTHVAGIAAGRASSLLPPGLQGVAPDARIAAFQTFSFDVNRSQPPIQFGIDFMIVMDTLAEIMTEGTTANPFVVNLSLGSANVFAGNCSAELPGIEGAIFTLFSRGVPVVAATGNAGSNAGISFPACVPRVVRVSSVDNDGLGNTRTTFANIADPLSYGDDRFWLAPGNAINSAAAGNSLTGLRSLAGTSQATPHISGLYALAKAVVPGVTVDGISNWIRDYASVPVTVNLCSAAAPCPTIFRRARIP